MLTDGVAIVGIGCRLPGGICDTGSYWKLLIEGREAVSEVPSDRWSASRFFDAEPGLTGKSVTRHGGFLDDIDQFDPQFFGISPREAPHVDPQHRLLLETSWEAIEDAGVVLDFENGSDVAVFAGVSHNDYQVIQATSWDHSNIGPHSGTGSAHSIAANRVSYCLNLLGPSIAVDTACSSALTAVHLACENIRCGRGEVALAGGVIVMITPGSYIGFSQASMLSPDGRCRAFDASANGFVRGEGAGMVLLKKLSLAIADNDPIYAVVVGSATNQDGHTNGMTVPSQDAQVRLVRDACRVAGVAPTQIGYVEAHGTGTAVGDPIEAHALSAALCQDRNDDNHLLIGSVKTNLGHLETAAGVAGLIKAALIAKHSKIPASLHFERPNPSIDFDRLKLRVPTSVEAFSRTEGDRIIGVNSFGFGGANAHVILAQPPNPPKPNSSPLRIDPRRQWPIVLSARSEDSLKNTALRICNWLEDRHQAPDNRELMPDLVYTLGARRNHHPHRLALVARSPTQLARELTEYALGESSSIARTTFLPSRESAIRVALVMCGQGPQWWGMGHELLKYETTFRESMEECDEAMRPYLGSSILEEFAREEEETQLDRTSISQPAIFSFQIAMTSLWRSWGIEPVAVVGHSVGEIAAAYVAGVLKLDDACRVVALRGRCMEDYSPTSGSMLAAALSADEARELLADHDGGVSIAAFNGPRSVTLSGKRVELERTAQKLERREIFHRFLQVEYPFHHAMMHPAAEALHARLQNLHPQKATIPFYSTVTGKLCSGESCNAAHWSKGVTEPVQFAGAISNMTSLGADVWLEIGPHPALVHAIKECLTDAAEDASVIVSARREHEHASTLEAAMQLHLAGVEIDFTAITPSCRVLSLPSYSWDRSRWWSENTDCRQGRLAPGGSGILDCRLPDAIPTWVARLDGRHMAFLKDHRVDKHTVFPAAAFLEMALEAATQLYDGQAVVIEDLEIRKPLILPDPPTSLTLQLAHDPETRTFSISSRIEPGTSWSPHVVGSIRGERVGAPVDLPNWNSSQDTTLEEMPLDRFYGDMACLGLHWGDEFRPLQRVFASNGTSEVTVALSEKIAQRVGEYAVHPVILDASLQALSAASMSMGTKRLKLPARFGRILYLRSPGPIAKIRANVKRIADDYLEGDMELYDESGQPCVIIEGHRAIGVSGSYQDRVRDLLYHVTWEQSQADVKPIATKPVDLESVYSVMCESAQEVHLARGCETSEAAAIAADDLAAVLIARGLNEMGVGAGSECRCFDADSLNVAEAMKPAFLDLVQGLVRYGLLEPDGGGHRPSAEFDQASASAEMALQRFLMSQSGLLVEGLLVSVTSAELGSILRGEKDAVQVLFSGANNELLEQFYGQGLASRPLLAGLSRAVQRIARHLPEGRPLRILEVGAGTGGLTANVLPLLECDPHTYTFTDVTTAFFPAAMQKLADYTSVEYKIFDLEKRGAQQSFQPESFDVVLGANVFHAVSDVRHALENVHELLVPGGTLMFMDIAAPQLWAQAVFGLTSGWWRFKDYHRRKHHPLLSRASWEAVLREAGFEQSLSVAGAPGSSGEGHINLLARKSWQEPAVDATRSQVTRPKDVDPPKNEVGVQAESDPTSWLVLADSSDTSNRLTTWLRDSGANCCIFRLGKFFESNEDVTIRADVPEDWDRAAKILSAAPPQRIVCLWGCDEPLPDAKNRLMKGTGSLLHLTKSIIANHPSASIRIDWVSRGVQPVGREFHEVSVEQAPAVAMLRVVGNEFPNVQCKAIDLPHEVTEEDFDHLCHELMRDDDEPEVALRGEARWLKRIARRAPTSEREYDGKAPLRLVSKERGTIDALRFAEFDPPKCGENEVLIDVKAAGLNFRDVLKALAILPAGLPDAEYFGDEVAGVVKAIGEGVSHVSLGDRVFGLAPAGLANQVVARAGDVRRIPAGLSTEEAVTLPAAFMTAWHSLVNVARLSRGERVLIHSGAGGVGMAAIQIAQHLGGEVIASAGNLAKRDLLNTLGVKHVLDSRRGDFAAAVMELTGGQGVDVVLNSLAGEAIPMGMSCLAEFGRFIEIGKRDLYQNSRVPLWPLRRNASFHVVAMEAIFAGSEEQSRQLLETVTDLVEEGALRPLPFRPFPACQTKAAFRLMAQGRHTGKIVVSFPDAMLPRLVQPLSRDFMVRPDACYLITGAFGGYGRVIARWLVEKGARRLVLNKLSERLTVEGETLLEELHLNGVQTRVVRADVASAADVDRVMDTCRSMGAPLRGVFHLAMAIDDAPLTELSWRRLEDVIAPKAIGAWLLHQQTKDVQLDCFVMFSSASSLMGNASQGNYAAANAFLDSLAHHRHTLGLPALAINWGMLGGDGYVARNQRVLEYLQRIGHSALSPGEVVLLMEAFLSAGFPQVAAFRVDWSKRRDFLRGLADSPMLKRVMASEVEHDASNNRLGGDWRKKIESASAAEREEVIIQAVREIVASVLRAKPTSLRAEQPLTELGLDSLMAVEIENLIESTIGVSLPPSSMMRARTIAQLAELLAEHLHGSVSPARHESSADSTEKEEIVDEVDAQALSNEQIDDLLAEQVEPGQVAAMDANG